MWPRALSVLWYWWVLSALHVERLRSCFQQRFAHHSPGITHLIGRHSCRVHLLVEFLVPAPSFELRPHSLECWSLRWLSLILLFSASFVPIASCRAWLFHFAAVVDGCSNAELAEGAVALLYPWQEVVARPPPGREVAASSPPWQEASSIIAGYSSRLIMLGDSNMASMIHQESPKCSRNFATLIVRRVFTVFKACWRSIGHWKTTLDLQLLVFEKSAVDFQNAENVSFVFDNSFNYDVVYLFVYIHCTWAERSASIEGV